MKPLGIAKRSLNRTANSVAITGCCRATSASGAGLALSVKNGWYRHARNSSGSDRLVPGPAGRSAGRALVNGVGEGGVGHFGDLGVGDQLPGVRVGERAQARHRPHSSSKVESMVRVTSKPLAKTPRTAAPAAGCGDHRTAAVSRGAADQDVNAPAASAR